MGTTLVTGGAGFIGSHLVDRLLARGDRVVAIDNFNPYYSPEQKHRNLKWATRQPGFRLVTGDIRDSASVESAFQGETIDNVIHIAAMAGVRYSIEQPRLYSDVNVGGLTTVLEVCRQHGVRSFVFASSSSVYGASAQVPFREDDDANSPISPYAATKRAGELICHTYHSLYGMPITCLRYFTAYGPRGRPDMAAYLFTRSVIEGQPIRMFGDGSTVRDYTYVGDIADGTIAALDAELPFEIINLGNSEEIPLAEFIRVVERVTGKTAIIEKAPMQAGDMPRTCADISKALRLLGYNPSISIDEGMRSFVDWYQTEARCIERSLDEGHSAHSNISNRSGP